MDNEKIKVGNYVRVRRQNFGAVYIGLPIHVTLEGRTGIVTSMGKSLLPIHVTLEGDTHETDFVEGELDLLDFNNGWFNIKNDLSEKYRGN